jgi:hypothetical protein
MLKHFSNRIQYKQTVWPQCSAAQIAPHMHTRFDHKPLVIGVTIITWLKYKKTLKCRAACTANYSVQICTHELSICSVQTSPVAMFIYCKHLHVKRLIAKDFRQVAIACMQLSCSAGLGACRHHATGNWLASHSFHNQP